jgi:hypothetical protein
VSSGPGAARGERLRSRFFLRGRPPRRPTQPLRTQAPDESEPIVGTETTGEVSSSHRSATGCRSPARVSPGRLPDAGVARVFGASPERTPDWCRYEHRREAWGEWGLQVMPPKVRETASPSCVRKARDSCSMRFGVGLCAPSPRCWPGFWAGGYTSCCQANRKRHHLTVNSRIGAGVSCSGSPSSGPRPRHQQGVQVTSAGSRGAGRDEQCRRALPLPPPSRQDFAECDSSRCR